MIKMFKKYPISVTIIRKYQNGLSVVKDRGRYFQKKARTKSGTIYHAFFRLKKLKKTIPAPEIEFYQDIEGKRHLLLLQISREEFLPLRYEEGILKGYVNVPVIENGQIKTDEAGNPILRPQEVVVFNTNVAIEEGKIVKLPALVSYKTYDWKQWLTSEYRAGTQLYGLQKFWEKYGTFITIAVGSFAILGIVFFALNKFVAISHSYTGALVNIVNSNKEIAMAIKDLIKHNITNIKPPY